jgi:hypothetical protein
MHHGHRWSPADEDWSVPPGVIRASDAEREQVARSLGQHFAEGRLDEAEFRDRLDRAFAAVTRNDLHRLVRDLPVEVPDRSRRVRRAPLPVGALVVAVLVVLALAAGVWAVPLVWLAAFWLFVPRGRGGRPGFPGPPRRPGGTWGPVPPLHPHHRAW